MTEPRHAPRNTQLPAAAVARLKEQAARRDSGTGFFTSDLSVNELALTRDAGFEPLGQVLGSCFYRVAPEWQTYNWRDSDQGRAVGYEMQGTTRGYAEARRLALERLREEAAILGADAVVGLRLDRREYDWGAGTI